MENVAVGRRVGKGFDRPFQWARSPGDRRHGCARGASSRFAWIAALACAQRRCSRLVARLRAPCRALAPRGLALAVQPAARLAARARTSAAVAAREPSPRPEAQPKPKRETAHDRA